jgi:G:T-mismatch repair DNA endonuclease (very short patch repair protein)
LSKESNSGQFKKGIKPWNYGLKGLKYKTYAARTGAHSKGWVMSEEERLKHKGTTTGAKNGQYGSKYIHSKLIKCPVCEKELHARAMGAHLTVHNPDKRKEINKKISKKRLLQVLPTKDTIPEIIMQDLLTSYSIPFQKHVNILDFCQPDIFIEPNICIFADGDYWHNRPATVQRDIKVNKFLECNGYKVVRYWEHEIKSDNFSKDFKEHIVVLERLGGEAII